ncbi:4-hydroxy-3-methylbut-2-enyl diphosphate reductase [Heliophilum fasciatum]|uniref:4-hydroxy-3-methylbut-2-enyl diphosphate reductase n=1 Tax=Heliophilum fasciatum TaxID=35700 RepID=A0A4R2RXH6_9FIRM|nr:4-hydroxy-3-methylbut-2-enyl diphosphate reductase [Heliophilum fasciatum]
MQVLLAAHAGFCFGVRRAIQQVEAELAHSGKVATYGPLIHNPQVIARLADQGVAIVDHLDMSTLGPVVIRSHGVGPAIYEQAAQHGVNLIDATCPFVANVQKAARDFTEQGYQVVIAGDADHPEVQGIVAWTGNRAIVVASGKEITGDKIQGKVALIAQTTLKEATFREVEAALRQLDVELIVKNTICSATAKRQEAAQQLVSQVEVMVVVGGRNSSNTRKLAQICVAAGLPTYHVEQAEELDPRWFKNVNQAGVTAGASTPHWIIEEVVQRMTEIQQEQELENNVPTEEAATEAAAPQVSEDANRELTMDDAEDDMGKSFEESLKNLKEGELVTGIVVKVRHDEILVDVGGKSEGVIPLREIAPVTPDSTEGLAKVGDEIKVVVLKAESEDGTLIVSRRRAIEREKIVHMEEAKEKGEILTGKVVAVVKGGLRVDVGLVGFVPASQIERGYVENMEKYIGQTLRMKVVEVDTRRNNVVLSQKAVLEEEHKQARGNTWGDLAEGQTRRGTVRRLTDFGAFVDLGGVDGLLHISEMSWGRIKHPSEVVKEGQELEVYVLKVDREKERVSLGLKQVLPNPWSLAVEKYPVGSVITVKVVRLTQFGAFAELEPGIDGLIHISQLANRRVNKPEDVVSVGQEVQVKVLEVRPEDQRISLSIRAIEEDANREEVTEYLEKQDNQENSEA